jgi:hypothetical protein
MKKLALPSFIVLISFCWLACQKKEESTIQIKSFPDWEAIASKLMERSDLVEGEKVILMAQPGSFIGRENPSERRNLSRHLFG